METTSPALRLIQIRFEEFLRSRNLKLTSQRRIILEEFFCHDGHVSAEDFYNSIHHRHPGLGQATIFRNLKLLTEAGLATEVRFDSRTARYEIARPGSHHDHIRCVECGLIIEFEDPRIEELQDLIAERFDIELTGHRLDLYGRCKSCREKTATLREPFIS